jgi:hypothetical protein
MRVLSFDVGLRNLAYADVTVDESGSGSAHMTLNAWRVIDAMLPDSGGSGKTNTNTNTNTKTKTKRRDPDAQAAALVQALDDEFGFTVFDHVLIENQPARTNPQMKAVQASLHTYFATLRHHVGCAGEVHLVSATQKLRVPGEADRTTTYRERKALSVERCRAMLRDELRDEAALRQLEAARKKDDLCDALLQASWFAKQKQQQQQQQQQQASSSASGGRADAQDAQDARAARTSKKLRLPDS